MSTPDLISRLSYGLQRLRATVPKIIASPPSQPRRAAVALIIRVVPAPDTPIPPQDAPVPTLSEFFSLDWVNAPGARAEVLFLKRAAAPSSNEASTSTAGGEAHVSFPGGRMDEEDENALYTAMRQTWEELGIDLAERDYVCVGQLDDREITTSLGKRLLMVLSPFVFLQLTPHPTSVDPLPDINLHWVSIDHLANAKPSWGSVTADISVRMAPRYPALRRIIRLLLGSMQFAAIVLNEPSIKGKEREIAPESDILKVWGLTLGMTLDLLALLHPPQRPKLPLEPDADGLYGLEMAPSMASVFPRFSYPDVNFWIWVFGRRYRNLIRDWEASIRYDVTGERRINWIGQAVNAFYGAVRRALLVVIVLRAIGLLLTIAVGGWWVFSSGL